VGLLTIVVFVFLAPEFFFFNFGTLDSPFAHLLVVLNFSVWEFTVFSEYDVEAKEEYT
jgi:hypothetical protein